MQSVRRLGNRVHLAVVDNNSSDDTIKLLRTTYNNIITHLHLSDENLGFGRAHNLVFNQPYATNYRYYLLLNQDAALPVRSLEVLWEQANFHGDFGVISPVHYFSEGKLDIRFRNYLNAGVQVGLDMLEVPFVNAAIWLLRREVVNKIGGFNPIFPHYGEDYNYLERMKMTGFRVGILTHALAFHYREQVPIPARYNRDPYHQWLTGLNRLVHPGLPPWRALGAVLSDYLPLVSHHLYKGNYKLAGVHTQYLVKLLIDVPRIWKHRKVRIGVPLSDQ
jgi:hypothetical protein